MDHEYKVGRVLFTKDGRRMGNAVVTGVADHSKLGKIYSIRTDFGNTAILTSTEIEEAFYVNNIAEERPVHNDPKARMQDQIDKLAVLKAYEEIDGK